MDAITLVPSQTALLVVPEGAQLVQQGNFIVVRTGDARMSMKIQLKSVSDPQQAIAQARKPISLMGL